MAPPTDSARGALAGLFLSAPAVPNSREPIRAVFVVPAREGRRTIEEK